jgi:hypothetical protein
LLNPANGIGSIEHRLLASARQASQLSRPWEGGASVFEHFKLRLMTRRLRPAPVALEATTLIAPGVVARVVDEGSVSATVGEGIDLRVKVL